VAHGVWAAAPDLISDIVVWLASDAPIGEMVEQCGGHLGAADAMHADEHDDAGDTADVSLGTAVLAQHAAR